MARRVYQAEKIKIFRELPFNGVTQMLDEVLLKRNWESCYLKMSSLGWLIFFLIFLSILVIVVYVVVVRAFYWGDKKEPPKFKKNGKETEQTSEEEA